MFGRIHRQGTRLAFPRGPLTGFLAAGFFLLMGPCLSAAPPLEVTGPGDLAEAEASLDSLEPRQEVLQLVEIFNYQLVNRNYTTAWEIIGEIEEQLKRLGNPVDLQARLKLARARLMMQQGRTAEALEVAETARGLAERSGELPVQAEVSRTLGNAFILMRDYTRGLDLFEEALEAAESLDDDPLKGTVLNSIAITYWRMEQWEESEQYLRQAQKLHPEESAMHYLLANNIGVALMEQGQYNEAEHYLLKALDFNREAESFQATGLNYSNLGDLYYRKGQPEKALRYLEEALDVEETDETRYLLTRSHRHLANVLNALGRTGEAIREGEVSIELARRMRDRAEEKDSWETLIRLMESSGRYREALEDFRKMDALEDDLLSEQTRLRSALFSARFAAAESTAQIEMLRQEQDLQNLWRNTILICLVIVAALAFALALRYRTLHRLNHQLALQKEEIERSHRSLKAANERLSRLNREKDEILGIAAHDLRNPIGAVRQLGIMLREDPELTDADRRELIENIITSAESVLEIVGKLLDINRIEEGIVSINWDRIEPARLLRSVSSHFEAAASRKDQRIDFLAPDEGHLVDGDWTLLHQSIGNLLSNALKYSPTGSSIRLNAALLPGEGLIRYTVEDQGPGISGEDQKRLFRKFARLSAKPTGGESSTGLGLFIVAKLVALMGGRIGCDSTPGKGTTFRIDLPVSKPEPQS
jgi:signal transduction histidine kinase